MIEGYGRIDKLVIYAVGDNYSAAAEADVWIAACQNEWQDRKMPGSCWDYTTHYNQQLKRQERAFEVWGELADWFIQQLPASVFQRVRRLDYRRDIEGTPPTQLDVYKAMVAQDPNGRNSTRLVSSPYRAKRGGRDAGGVSAISGSSDSDRRLSVYIRGKEGPAVEVQLSGVAVKRLLQTAYNSYLAINGLTLYEYILREADKELNQICGERIGCGYDTLSHGRFYDQLDMQPLQESLEWDAIKAFNEMDAPTRERFMAYARENSGE